LPALAGYNSHTVVPEETAQVFNVRVWHIWISTAHFFVLLATLNTRNLIL